MIHYKLRRNPIVSDEHYRNTVVLGKSNHSYAINQQIITRFNSNSWAGRRCFIIAGGPSCTDFDSNCLANELTIGVNLAFIKHQKLTINYAMDETLYDQITKGELDFRHKVNVYERWMSFSGTRVFLTPMSIKKFGSEVVVVRRVRDRRLSRDLDYGIWDSSNSATGAIMLAIALGSKFIYLLGYDMQTDGQRTHWHAGYDDRQLDEFNAKLAEYRTELDNIAPELPFIGVTVLNLNRASALQCFPPADLEQVLRYVPQI